MVRSGGSIKRRFPGLPILYCVPELPRSCTYRRKALAASTCGTLTLPGGRLMPPTLAAEHAEQALTHVSGAPRRAQTSGKT